VLISKIYALKKLVKTVAGFRTNPRACTTPDAVITVFDRHDHSDIILLVIVEIVAHHITFLFEIKYITGTDFVATATADTGFRIDSLNEMRVPFPPTFGQSNYTHVGSP